MGTPTGTYESDEMVRYIQQLGENEGKLESPINLNISHMRVIELNPIEWHNYNVMPKKLKFTNTGYTVTLSAKWHSERPYLCGGPFVGNYIFSQIHFHWGENDMNGSEHHVDGGSMPMELHAVHFKSDYETQETALRRDDGVTVLVYLFQLQAAPNPLLNEIITALPFVQAAHSSIRLVPFPLTNIIRCFQRDYFVYWGSVKMMNYTNALLWLISREPLGISAEQVSRSVEFIDEWLSDEAVKAIVEFRTLYDERKMPILTNCRPLRDKADRNVFHVCPSGSRYATLLPIRDYRDTRISEGNVENNDGQAQ